MDESKINRAGFTPKGWVLYYGALGILFMMDSLPEKNNK
jgi:hypothetical protein